MFKFVCAANLIFAASIATAEGFGPSVWDQMQHESANASTGKITSLEIGDQGIEIGVTSNGDQATTKFCDDSAGSEGESYRSAQAVARLEILREAFKSGEKVELTYDGPWKPCLRSVRIVRAEKPVAIAPSGKRKRK